MSKRDDFINNQTLFYRASEYREGGNDRRVTSKFFFLIGYFLVIPFVGNRLSGLEIPLSVEEIRQVSIR